MLSLHQVILLVLTCCAPPLSLKVVAPQHLKRCGLTRLLRGAGAVNLAEKRTGMFPHLVHGIRPYAIATCPLLPGVRLTVVGAQEHGLLLPAGCCSIPSHRATAPPQKQHPVLVLVSFVAPRQSRWWAEDARGANSLRRPGMEGAAVATGGALPREPVPGLVSGLRCRGVRLRDFVPRILSAGARKPGQKLGVVRAQQFEFKDKSAIYSPFGDSLANSNEVRQWESGHSFHDIAASQGIKIRRRPLTGPPHHYVGPFEFRLENEGNTPRNILEEIIWYKDNEVQQRKPLALLKGNVADAPPVRDFIGALRTSYDRTGMPALIAEVKKASPSRGVLREDFHPVHIANAYEAGGAACLSVLTDEKFFQGSFENLEAIRNSGVKCPLLCKEFIIEAWQIYYARCKGADAILLIAAVLPNLDIKYMTKICKMLGMAALVELKFRLWFWRTGYTASKSTRAMRAACMSGTPFSSVRMPSGIWLVYHGAKRTLNGASYLLRGCLFGSG
ncbi:hypothetical protein Taro_045749 [Colocasia esculenta]|uniref:indole-3-glycerol-phosphate synthase n=1 Tax=Colocasia esculenta TaxID=4460 RepID=A0A843X6T2_COLES|nr:hypothetical protein [Colocasia esculenta]